jgi:hypothetical protein
MNKYARFMFSPHDLNDGTNRFPIFFGPAANRPTASERRRPELQHFHFSNRLRMEWGETFQDPPIYLVCRTESL